MGAYSVSRKKNSRCFSFSNGNPAQPSNCYFNTYTTLRDLASHTFLLLQIDCLAKATTVIQERVQGAPLCRRELCAITAYEIEEAERFVLEGLNYQLLCHHPDGTLHALVSDVICLASESKRIEDHREPSDYEGSRSPRTSTGNSALDYIDELWERAQAIALRALVFSDAPFLVAPIHTAFAIVTILLGPSAEQYMGEIIASRLDFPSKEERFDFCLQIRTAIQVLESCPMVDLRSRDSGREIAMERAEALRVSLAKVANIRLLRSMGMEPSTPEATRKRSKTEPGRIHERRGKKLVRVSPQLLS